MVPEEFLRTGRRVRRSHGKADLKNKPRDRQRKATLKLPPIHPDLMDAYHLLMNGNADVAAIVQAAQDKANHDHIEDIAGNKDDDSDDDEDIDAIGVGVTFINID